MHYSNSSAIISHYSIFGIKVFVKVHILIFYQSTGSTFKALKPLYFLGYSVIKSYICDTIIDKLIPHQSYLDC